MDKFEMPAELRKELWVAYTYGQINFDTEVLQVKFKEWAESCYRPSLSAELSPEAIKELKLMFIHHEHFAMIIEDFKATIDRDMDSEYKRILKSVAELLKKTFSIDKKLKYENGEWKWYGGTD